MRALLTSIFAAVALICGVAAFAPTASAVDVLTPVCQNQPSSSVCQDNQTGGSNPIFGPDGIMTTVINWLSRIIGIAAIFVIMISGFMLINSGGDSNTATTARRNLVYALIGLVVAAFAQTLVLFVLSKL